MDQTVQFPSLGVRLGARLAGGTAARDPALLRRAPGARFPRGRVAGRGPRRGPGSFPYPPCFLAITNPKTMCSPAKPRASHRSPHAGGSRPGAGATSRRTPTPIQCQHRHAARCASHDPGAIEQQPRRTEAGRSGRRGRADRHEAAASSAGRNAWANRRPAGDQSSDRVDAWPSPSSRTKPTGTATARCRARQPSQVAGSDCRRADDGGERCRPRPCRPPQPGTAVNDALRAIVWRM